MFFETQENEKLRRRAPCEAKEVLYLNRPPKKYLKKSFNTKKNNGYQLAHTTKKKKNVTNGPPFHEKTSPPPRFLLFCQRPPTASAQRLVPFRRYEVVVSVVAPSPQAAQEIWRREGTFLVAGGLLVGRKKRVFF